MMMNGDTGVNGGMMINGNSNGGMMVNGNSNGGMMMNGGSNGMTILNGNNMMNGGQGGSSMQTMQTMQSQNIQLNGNNQNNMGVVNIPAGMNINDFRNNGGLGTQMVQQVGLQNFLPYRRGGLEISTIKKSKSIGF